MRGFKVRPSLTESFGDAQSQVNKVLVNGVGVDDWKIAPRSLSIRS
jgi:hypothetical protein